jgi:hypothetical protein
MSYCPQCGAEYRAGFDECSDCLIPLVDERPQGEPVPAKEVFDRETSPNLVAVYMADRMQAELVRAAIEGSGVPAVLFESGYSAAYPLTVGSLGETRVMVREEDREQALDIIAAATGEELSVEADEPTGSTRWFPGVVIVGIAIVLILAIARSGAGP